MMLKMTNKKIYAEIARTPQEHFRGLMGRKYLSSNSGMLFDFGKEKPLSFWMSNTYIPLQIAFINENGRIGQIERMVPLSTKSVRSHGQYRYALEVHDGWFDKHGIQIGAQVALPNTSEQQIINPDIQIEQSKKDILKAISDYNIKIIIEYRTKDGQELPPKTIEPPFSFSDTSEGDSNGLLTAWDCQKGRFSSFIVENIISVKDLNGNPIENTQTVEQIYKNIPLSSKEQDFVRGIVPNTQ